HQQHTRIRRHAGGETHIASASGGNAGGHGEMTAFAQIDVDDMRLAIAAHDEADLRLSWVRQAQQTRVDSFVDVRERTLVLKRRIAVAVDPNVTRPLTLNEANAM